MPDQFPDVVVLVPGITGSVLERHGREVWAASAEAMLRGLFSGGRSIEDLLLEHDDPDADYLSDGVRAVRLVDDIHLFPGLWTIDGYTKAALRLRQRLKLAVDVNYFEFPYDWRRDNRVAARKLRRESAEWLVRRRKTFPGAKLVLVAHSMGGLVSRYFLEVLGGWRDTRALITFGTPYRGSINALDSIINGVKKAGVLDLTNLCRSFSSVYQLLPIYPCLDPGTGRLVRLTEAETIPGLNRDNFERVQAAEVFHREIERAVEKNRAALNADVVRYKIHPVVGIEQPTSQTAVVRGGRVEFLRSRDGRDELGDGTVPRLSATPIEEGETLAAFAASRHGALQNTDAVLAHVQGVLTTPRDLGNVRAVGASITLSLDIEGFFAWKEPVHFAIRPSQAGVTLEATIESTNGSDPKRTVTLAASDDAWVRCELPPLAKGVYRITVAGDPTEVEPVSDVFAVA